MDSLLIACEFLTDENQRKESCAGEGPTVDKRGWRKLLKSVR